MSGLGYSFGRSNQISPSGDETCVIELTSTWPGRAQVLLQYMATHVSPGQPRLIFPACHINIVTSACRGIKSFGKHCHYVIIFFQSTGVSQQNCFHRVWTNNVKANVWELGKQQGISAENIARTSLEKPHHGWLCNDGWSRARIYCLQRLENVIRAH